MSAPEPAAPGAPGDHDPSETFNFTSADGAELYGEYFAAEGARGLALVLHGYAEHAGRYREVAHLLHGLRHHVLSFDFRGHGRSSGQRGHVIRFTEYLDDAEAALTELRARGGELPVLLVSHSNGALIALRQLADSVRAPDNVYAAVLSSPFLGLKIKVPVLKGLLGKVASRVAPGLSLPNDLDIEALTSDPERQAARRVDTLCHDVASARWFTEAIQTQRWVLDFAHRIEIPTLWLVAGNDRIADPAAARAVHDRVRAPSTYEELSGMEHEVFNERERASVFARLSSFADSHFPS